MWLLLVVVATTGGSFHPTFEARDCSNPHSIERLVLPLTRDCSAKDDLPLTKHRMIKAKDRSHHPAHYCRVTVSSLLFYCGAFSHSKNTRLRTNIPVLVTQEECEKMRDQGIYVTPERGEAKIAINKPTYWTATSRGSLRASTTNTNCNGIPTMIGSRMVEQMMELRSYKISIFTDTLSYANGTFSSPSKHLSFATETNTSSHVSVDDGTWVFEPTPDLDCTYDDLSETNTYLSTEGNLTTRVDKTRGLALPDIPKVMKCGAELIPTDYHGIFLAPMDTPEITLIEQGASTVDIEVMNKAAIDYTTFTTRKALEMELCYQLARTAPLNPMETSMYKDHLVIPRGDLVYYFKCKNVLVEARLTTGDTCTTELAVNHDGKTRFMKPRTHILSDYFTLSPCSEELPPAFMDHQGRWFTQNPHTMMVENPVAALPTSGQTGSRASQTKVFNEQAKDDLANIIHMGHVRTSTLAEAITILDNTWDVSRGDAEIPTLDEILEDIGRNFNPLDTVTRAYLEVSKYLHPVMDFIFVVVMGTQTWRYGTKVRTLNRHGLSNMEAMKTAWSSANFLLEVAHQPPRNRIET